MLAIQQFGIIGEPIEQNISGTQEKLKYLVAATPPELKKHNYHV